MTEQIQEARRRFLGSRLWQHTEGMPAETPVRIEVEAIGGYALNLTLGDLRGLRADLERDDAGALLRGLETATAWIDQLTTYVNPDPSAPYQHELLEQLRAAVAKARP